MRNLFLILAFTISLVSIHGHGGYSEQPPNRIVSLSPSITEIVHGLGALDKIVGVTLYTDFPPEAEELPKVGGWVDPNFEAILELNPDLVMMIEDQNNIFGHEIRKLGLSTLSVDCNGSIKKITNSVQQIGRAMGREEKARELVEKISRDLEKISHKTTSIAPKRLLFVVGRNPGTLEDIYVIGKANFVNEMITLAGGENVVDSDRLAIKISREAILKLNPEVIIEANHEKIEKKEVMKDWRELSLVSAVKNSEIHTVSSSLLRPSQRIVEGTTILAKILHPEVFQSNGKVNNQPLAHEGAE